MASDSAGNIYIGEDRGGEGIRRVNQEGVITTVAGTGIPGFSGDGGLAANARIGNPTAMAVDSAGTLYFADKPSSFTPVSSGDWHLRKISPAGIITSIIPNFTGYQLNGMTFDHTGNLYVSTSCNAVYRISPSGAQSLFAGTSCVGGLPSDANAGYNGDNIPATQAMLNSPTGLASDDAGNIYIADTANSRIRKVSPDGIITTVANIPSYLLAVTPSGTIFAASGAWVVTVSNGVVGSWAGNDGLSSNAPAGDGGPATAASVQPSGMALDPSGNLYLSENAMPFLHDVREVLAETPVWTVSPSMLSFRTPAGVIAPDPQFVRIQGTSWAATVVTSDGAPWLMLSKTSGGPATVSVAVNPKGLVPGAYAGTIRFTSPATALTWSVEISLTVLPSTPPKLYLSNQVIELVATQGSQAVQRSAVLLRNVGGGTLTCAITAKTNFGGNWLTIPATQVSIPGETSLYVYLTASPAGLSAGAYTGSVTINVGSQPSVTNTIRFTISAPAPALAVSQKALSFIGVAGGGKSPTQSFAVLNDGPGTLTWTAKVEGVFQGPAWLSIASTSGSSGGAGSAVPRIAVTVDTSGLTPGLYNAQVTVVAEGPNDPAHSVFAMARFVLVYLTVMPAGSVLSPVIQPAGLIFQPIANAPDSAQQVVISNPGGQTLTFTSNSSSAWFAQSPSYGSIAPGQAAVITVRSTGSALTPGTVRGSLSFTFGDGSVKTVDLVSVVPKSTTVSGSPAIFRPQDSNSCAPARLVGVLTSLSDFDAVNPGKYSGVRARIVDDCGNPMVSGSVTAVFSGDDPPLQLNSTARANGSPVGPRFRLAV